MGVIRARLYAVGVGELMRTCLRFCVTLAARGLEMAREAALPPPAPPVAPLARVGLVSVVEMAAVAAVQEARRCEQRRRGAQACRREARGGATTAPAHHGGQQVLNRLDGCGVCVAFGKQLLGSVVF